MKQSIAVINAGIENGFIEFGQHLFLFLNQYFSHDNFFGFEEYKLVGQAAENEIFIWGKIGRGR